MAQPNVDGSARLRRMTFTINLAVLDVAEFVEPGPRQTFLQANPQLAAHP